MHVLVFCLFFFFFFNDTATTEIYTLSLHDALPIWKLKDQLYKENIALREEIDKASMFEEIVGISPALHARSEEHTSELQSRLHLVCRLLLEKKKKKKNCTESIREVNSSECIYDRV